ncbi:HEAT repeat domain-containing protein [Methanosarcina horonobensis]|uniref:HEAT repeat domain-containing protein n=1 Tax=Methanosarcina horonobensis TaxID=418008 RepID=UPI000B338488|nr:hypothetical protein [Methanosarcina horonobensis]
MVDQSNVHERTFSPSLDERTDFLQQLITCFGFLPDRQQALEDIIRLCSDEDKTLRGKAINTLGTFFIELSGTEKEKVWNRLLELLRTEDPEVWKAVALSIVSAFGYMPEKRKAWDFLLRLAEDESSYVRTRAVEVLILLFPSMPDREKIWADFIALAGSEHGEVRELASNAFILIYLTWKIENRSGKAC